MSGQSPNDAVMGALVMGNKDVVGLLAYAIYSQFRDEWQAGFVREFGREPSAHECAVYDLGERTPRKAMTYRFLADSRVLGSYADTRGSATDAFRQKVLETGARAGMQAAARSRPAMRRMAPVFAIAALAGVVAVGLNSGDRVPLSQSFALQLR